MGVTITGKNGITSRQRPGGIYRIAGADGRVAAGEQPASGLSQMFHH
jgi:hypothetical protein